MVDSARAIFDILERVGERGLDGLPSTVAGDPARPVRDTTT
jgi:hypothetical protein